MAPPPRRPAPERGCPCHAHMRRRYGRGDMASPGGLKTPPPVYFIKCSRVALGRHRSFASGGATRLSLLHGSPSVVSAWSFTTATASLRPLRLVPPGLPAAGAFRGTQHCASHALQLCLRRLTLNYPEGARQAKPNPRYAALRSTTRQWPMREHRCSRTVTHMASPFLVGVASVQFSFQISSPTSPFRPLPWCPEDVQHEHARGPCTCKRRWPRSPSVACRASAQR